MRTYFVGVWSGVAVASVFAELNGKPGWSLVIVFFVAATLMVAGLLYGRGSA